MKTKLFAMLVAVIVAVNLVGCSFTVNLGNSTPAPVVPTLAPVAPVAPTVSAYMSQSSIDALAKSFGFHKDSYVCTGTPCHSFTYDSSNAYVSILTYEDGSFAITCPISSEKGYNVDVESPLVARFVMGAASKDVALWLIDHTELNSTADGTVDGYSISVKTELDAGVVWVTYVVFPDTSGITGQSG